MSPWSHPEVFEVPLCQSQNNLASNYMKGLYIGVSAKSLTQKNMKCHHIKSEPKELEPTNYMKCYYAIIREVDQVSVIILHIIGEGDQVSVIILHIIGEGDQVLRLSGSLLYIYFLLSIAITKLMWICWF